jgi:hypothetical protein
MSTWLWVIVGPAAFLLFAMAMLALGAILGGFSGQDASEILAGRGGVEPSARQAPAHRARARVLGKHVA